MWTRLSSLLAAIALAALLTITSSPDPAWAVICGNISEPGGTPATPNAAGATDGGNADNTACGQNSNASGDLSANTAIGNAANASAPGIGLSSNTAIGDSANASGTISSNTATGNLANANGDGSSNVASGRNSNASGDGSGNVASGA